MWSLNNYILGQLTLEAVLRFSPRKAVYNQVTSARCTAPNLIATQTALSSSVRTSKGMAKHIAAQRGLRATAIVMLTPVCRQTKG
jgi:hypothetical protein